MIKQADTEDEKTNSKNIEINNSNSVAEELTKLAALLEKGLISEEEFRILKNKLLS